MYRYANIGRLPIPGLPARDLDEAEFAEVVEAYAETFPATDAGEIVERLIVSEYYVTDQGRNNDNG